jgi:hypothetical protein
MRPFAYSTQDFQTVEIGQTEIKKYDIRIVGRSLGKTFLSRRRLYQNIAVALKRHPQEASHLGFVFDK